MLFLGGIKLFRNKHTKFQKWTEYGGRPWVSNTLPGT